MIRHVLVIAYYFPPMGLSGVQRVSKLVKYLPDFGWHPTVLTVEPGGYYAYDQSLLQEIEDAGIPVVRTKSLDPLRIFGSRKVVRISNEGRRNRLSRLSQYIFIPDNKIGWLPYAIRRGKKLLENRSYDLIFSSAPPYTAHIIATTLGKWHDIPTVLDFRDDWMDNPRHHYPSPIHRMWNRKLEGKVISNCKHVFTINTVIRGALLARHSNKLTDSEITVLHQGFDPQDFEVRDQTSTRTRMRILYSGIFYDAQTPDFFLKGIARLVKRQPSVRDELELVFVGMVPNESIQLARQLGLGDMITLFGYVPHNEAVATIKTADVLWMTVGRRQGAISISTGKLFEYFGAIKPILALVPEGAARSAVIAYGASVVVEPDDIAGISDAISGLYSAWKDGTLPVPDRRFVRQFDRREIAGKAARHFSEIIHATARNSPQE